jgi:plasmid segregation protein ParM
MAEKSKAAPAEPIIMPLDIGFGFTKYGKIIDGTMKFLSYQSLAPMASDVDMSMGILGKRDTVIVDVDGTDYEVGPDSEDLDTSESTRSLNDQYIYTDQYKALFYGSLHYMGEKTIDLLVVGLPVSNLNHAEKLKSILIGTHEINKSETYEVKDVLVLPQPLGGLYYCMSQKENPLFADLADEVNLIVDPGYLTFDFLYTNGVRPIEKKSDAHPGGVSKILKSISESISKKFDKHYNNHSAIDKALRRNPRMIKVAGKKEDLLEHIKNTHHVIESSVTYMQNMIGDGSDVDNIIVIGGGSHIFDKTIKKHFPDNDVIIVEDPQLSVVKGYFEAGKKYLSQ